jgi:hypothetical protein
MKRTATQTEISAFERRIRELMAEGYGVRFAVHQAYKEHPVMQTLQREVAAQIRAEAERGYGDSLPQGITDRLFTHSWTPDGLTLSERTTHASILVREMVARTISEQIKKSTSYRQASLAIFDGYRQGGVIPVQDVPKYLAETMAIARHASIPRDEILKMLKPIRRQIEKGTTAGMRAAYSQLMDALETQNEKALNRAIFTATQERTRYFADRIARTEMARAYQDGFLLKWDNNDDCVAYQWKLSGRHPRYDICDLYAKANLYGMGAGVFPKDKVPRLPAHPHCMCFLKPVIRGMIDNETPIERIEEGGREYLDSVDLHHRQMLLGIHGEKDVMDGKISWTQKARGYGGKKIDSRLSQEGAKSGTMNIKQIHTFIPAKKISEAEDYARSILGIPNVSYKGCDVDTANAWNRGLHDAFSRFPELKKNFGFVGEAHERNAMLKPILRQHYADDYRKRAAWLPPAQIDQLADAATRKTMKQLQVAKGTLAVSFSESRAPFSEFRGVSVNREHGKDAKKFAQVLAKDVGSKFHPVGCDSIRSVLDHEIGHQLDNLLGIRDIQTIKDLYDSRTHAELSDALSRYAWDNKNRNRYAEMIAEAWAEYCNNPKPRDIAKIVGKTIEAEYQKQFGKGGGTP